ANQLEAALVEPFCQPAQRLQRIGLMRFDDDTDAFDRSVAHSVRNAGNAPDDICVRISVSTLIESEEFNISIRTGDRGLDDTTEPQAQLLRRAIHFLDHALMFR